MYNYKLKITIFKNYITTNDFIGTVLLWEFPLVGDWQLRYSQCTTGELSAGLSQGNPADNNNNNNNNNNQIKNLKGLTKKI